MRGGRSPALRKPQNNRRVLPWKGETPYARSKAQLRLRTVDPVSSLSGDIGLRGVQQPCHRQHGGQQCPARVKAYRVLTVARRSWVCAQAPRDQGVSGGVSWQGWYHEPCGSRVEAPSCKPLVFSQGYLTRASRVHGQRRSTYGRSRPAG